MDPAPLPGAGYKIFHLARVWPTPFDLDALDFSDERVEGRIDDFGCDSGRQRQLTRVDEGTQLRHFIDQPVGYLDFVQTSRFESADVFGFADRTADAGAVKAHVLVEPVWHVVDDDVGDGELATGFEHPVNLGEKRAVFPATD